ncbi:MAG: hypothetical protein HY282_03245 [Nitrospirae bacterium]|nr:hypothetical protein [Candidatus Manganitrophaceae bacterium]
MSAPRLHYIPPLPMMRLHEVQLTASVADRSGVDAVLLFYRKKGTQGYRSIPFERKGGNDREGLYRVSIPRMEVGSEGVEYYLVAESRAGQRSFKGDPARPLLLKIAAPAISALEVRQRFEELRRAWQARDLARIEALSSLSTERKTFLRQLFDHYRAIAIEMSWEGDKDEEGVWALFTIKELVDQEGNSVVPGAGWSQARIQLPWVLDKEGEWKKLIWE